MDDRPARSGRLVAIAVCGAAVAVCGAAVAACGGGEPAPTRPAPSEPSQVAFLTEPADADVREPIDPPVRVEVQDASGERVEGASVPIEITLSQDPTGGEATLAGQTVVTSVDGVAVFPDLALDLRGRGFVLRARSEGLVGDLSRPFAVRLRFASVTAGRVHSCGLTFGGYAYCWGSNDEGQLGDGTRDARTTPVAVTGDNVYSALEAGGRHTCGVTPEDEIHCWGLNVDGQLGDGSDEGRSIPGPVAGGRAYAAVSAGLHHTCALTPEGDAWCWGFNGAGQLGWGDISRRELTPRLDAGGHTFRGIAAGHDHTCAVTPADEAWCWGENAARQLGTEEWEYAGSENPWPVPVSGGHAFAAVGAGAMHSCGVTPGGEAYCWGFEGNGRLGNGASEAQSHATPQAVAGGLLFGALHVGAAATCATTEEARAYCWGANAGGQLGDGTDQFRSSPEPVAGDHPFTEARPGVEHSCGVTAEGDAHCWGANDRGQLGDGSMEGTLVPVRVDQG